MSKYGHLHLYCAGPEVGLELTSLTVSESAGSVQLCVAVLSPIIECPIQFPFPIILTASSRSTGKKNILQNVLVTVLYIICK